MEDCDWKGFFAALGFSGDESGKLADFFISCKAAAVAAGVGLGGLAMSESLNRNPTAKGGGMVLITGIVGALIMGGGAYVVCNKVKSHTIDALASQGDMSDPAVVALRLTDGQRKAIIDEARKLLRFRPSESKAPELYA